MVPRRRVGIWCQSITINEFGVVSSPDALRRAFWSLNPILRIGLREIWLSNHLIAGVLRDPSPTTRFAADSKLPGSVAE
ncbi:protein of unknown function [uncultured Woeseiaceae bacterium]|uniref:Uncharacterized protein n=1 Tax=uncultured Woeseiaceae bacterium TaxID=1983305 RepID=A0A7D9H465_9GAMM|nr:protein of unknown function [uncultured Woeseiaceae bacterium]